jgi:peptidoglycan-N-acetylglucosamine deacetylase
MNQMLNTPSHVWRPSPIIWASFVLHGVALIAVAFAPALWPWALAAIVANHLSLTAIGLWPRSQLLGPNILRLNQTAAQAKQVTLSFDDGPHPEVTPWVLDQLDQHNAKATFFCVGEKVRAFPAIAKEIVNRGHVIENHSDLHSHAFSTFGLGRLGRDIDAAQATIREHGGHAPTLFRAPAGLRSPLLETVLARRGLTLASWTRRGFDTVEKNPDKIYTRLATGLSAGDILLIHDGNCAIDANGLPVIRTVLPRLLDRIDELQLTVVPIRAKDTATNIAANTIGFHSS